MKCAFYVMDKKSSMHNNSRSIQLLSLLVMGRVYPNPKTRRVFDDFHKPEATRTRNFDDLLGPKLPEPEIYEFM